MNILDKIIADKRIEIAQKKKILTESIITQFDSFEEECASLKFSLLEEDATGIIAEFKKKSPSKGWINKKANVLDVVTDYMCHGATGISILTDEIYFGGLNDDLMEARIIFDGPILRKDFIIDEYQITEAKAIGADVVLLIASCLTKQQVKKFAFKAHELGMEVLLEIHDESELGHISELVDLVGVNNRNLKTLEIDIQTSLRLAKEIPEDKIKISESGISSVDDILLLKQNGFKGFLIGENFMKEKDPGLAFEEFVNALKLAPPHAEGF
jgi:indole-3-glycerol phosphate synthase